MSTLLIAPPPAVKVGGKSYVIRFSQGAFYLLGTWGIDLSRPVAVHNEMIAAGRGKEYAAKIACAALGNFDGEGRWRSLGLSPLEVMDSLLDGEWEALDAAAWDAYKKKLGLVPIATETSEAASGSSTKSAGSSSGPSAPDVPPVDSGWVVSLSGD